MKLLNCYAVKGNLTEFTTKSVCVPLKVCRFVMHMRLCFWPCQHSFMPCIVLWGVCTSASVSGLPSLAFCSIHSCTCTSACLEVGLVSLCNQCSSVVHMCLDPLCICCSEVLPLSIASGLFSCPTPCPPSLFPIAYYISVTGALLPFWVESLGWVTRICQL